MTYTDTQKLILNTCEELIQVNGFNAFSYKDIAKKIGIKTSSIHYHYPTKVDLALSVIDWQLEKMTPILQNIKTNNRTTLKTKIEKFLDAIYSITFLDEQKMCLGGMFASDILSLPDELQKKVRDFFSHLKLWIVGVIEQHQEDRKSLSINKDLFAKQLLSQIEGSLLMARLYDDASYLELPKQFLAVSL